MNLHGKCPQIVNFSIFLVDSSLFPLLSAAFCIIQGHHGDYKLMFKIDVYNFFEVCHDNLPPNVTYSSMSAVGQLLKSRTGFLVSVNLLNVLPSFTPSLSVGKESSSQIALIFACPQLICGVNCRTIARYRHRFLGIFNIGILLL